MHELKKKYFVSLKKIHIIFRWIWKGRKVNERRKNTINSKYLIRANLFACSSRYYYLVFIAIAEFCRLFFLLNYSVLFFFPLKKQELCCCWIVKTTHLLYPYSSDKELLIMVKFGTRMNKKKCIKYFAHEKLVKGVNKEYSTNI